jgi:transcriptional regulator with AAA-type ATPase domain
MKNTYITWHYTTHGVAYLKHILSEFYKLGSIPSDLNLVDLNQTELNEVFDKPNVQRGFLFDEVIYLTAKQRAFDNLSSRRFSYKNTIIEDELIINAGLQDVWMEIVNSKFCYNMEKEIDFVRRKYQEKLKDFENLLWRNIQHYSIDEQLKWLLNFSNFKNQYHNKFNVVELEVDDLRDEKIIADKVSEWAKKYFYKQKDTQNIVNVSLGSSETQVVWHILAEAGQLPSNTRFIKTYDDKTDDLNNRFKKFSIVEVSTNLISNISADFTIYKETKSPSRLLVNKKMNYFLDSGFSILLIGERGIGKSQLAAQAREKIDSKIPFKEANCASFADDDKAEAELFGVAEKTFTGVAKRKGLMEEADGGILFLDEIHHLSKQVQAKLMKALQTDNRNKMAIRKVGTNDETKIELKIIFATNKSISELRKELLPDFYDRIVQHVLFIPPLRETTEDRVADWENIWKGLRFKGNPLPPYENELIRWIRELPLYGNYRDLQKIAIYYNVFNQFDMEIRNLISEKTAYQYTKNEFEKYHSKSSEIVDERFNFNTKQTTKEMIADYLFELQDWAIKKFKSSIAAEKHFKELGDTINRKSFHDWKNKKSINK